MGADLILYRWVIISLTLIVNLHLKLRDLQQAITTIATEQAFANPSREADWSARLLFCCWRIAVAVPAVEPQSRLPVNDRLRVTRWC